MPGCATLTEIVTAKENGAQVIKVFPGSVLGPGFVSSIMPVVPDLQLMITGGVEPNEKNLSGMVQSGSHECGNGFTVVHKRNLREEGLDGLRKKCSGYPSDHK